MKFQFTFLLTFFLFSFLLFPVTAAASSVNSEYLSSNELTELGFQRISEEVSKKKSVMPYYIVYKYIDAYNSSSNYVAVFCSSDVPTIFSGKRSNDDYETVRAFLPKGSKYVNCSFSFKNGIVNCEGTWELGETTYNYSTPTSSPYSGTLPAAEFMRRKVGDKSNPFTVKILFTNLDLADSAGNITEFPPKYSLNDCSSGLKPGETSADSGDDEPGFLEGIVEWLSNIGSKLGVLVESVGQFFTDFSDMVISAISDALSFLFIPTDISLPETAEKRINEKFPIYGQVKLLANALTSKDPYIKAGGFDVNSEGKYGPDNQYRKLPMNFSFTLPKVFMKGSEKDRTFNLLNWQFGALDSVAEKGRELIKAFLWIGYVMMWLKRRIPNLLSTFKM